MKRIFTLIAFCLTIFCANATAPTTPSSNLTSSAIEGNAISLNWTSGNGVNRIVIARKDNPVSALPINGTDYIASTNFGLGNEISTGQFVVFKGNGNGFTLSGLIPNSIYYIAIFEFNGSSFTTEYLTSAFLSGSRSTLSAPTTQVSNFTISNVTGNSLKLNYTNGNGTSRLIVAKAGGPVNANPTDLVYYFANAQFGSGDQVGAGNYVVSKGSGPVTVTGLQPNTTYYFSAFEFNGNNGPVYLTVSPPIVNQLTAPRPSIASSNIFFSGIEGNTLTLGMTVGNGARRLVVAKAGSPVTAMPIDGTTYTANNSFGSGQQIAPNEYVIGDGTPSSYTPTNLQFGVTYYFAVFEYDGTGTNTSYLTTSFLSGSRSTIDQPTVQTSNFNVSTVTNNSITLNWTSGNGGNRIIVARKDSAVNALPVNYVNYVASVFGAGSQIGTGNWIVYKGSGTTATISGLSFNTTYYFTILELNGVAAPVYLTVSPPVTHTTTASAPTIPAGNLFFNATEGNSFSFSWTSGNGTGRIVVAKAGSAVAGLPVNGTSYTANNVFGSGATLGAGEYVVYSGSGSSMSLTNLSIGTTYYFAIFEFNGTGGTSAYLTTSYLTGSKTTLNAPTVQTVSINVSNIIGNSMQVNLGPGNGQQRLVVARQGIPVNSVPVNLTTYSGATTFGAGTQIGAGNFVVQANNANSFTMTGLQPNTTYYFASFEFNGSTGPVYNTVSPATANANTLSGPTIASSNLIFSNIEGNSMQIAWTIGNGTKRIVVARQGSPVTAIPVNGTNYPASSAFGAGTAISAGQFVVANTTSNFILLSNLSIGTQYYFAIYEYDGTGTNISYLTSSFCTGSATTISAPTLQTSNLLFTSITNTSMTLNWTNGNGANRLVILRAGSPVNATPADLTSYFSSSNLPYASQVSPGNYAVFNGSASSINVFTLQAGVTYHYAIYEFNGISAPVYLSASPVRGSATTIGPPQTQATNAVASAINVSAASLSWTNGDGQKRIVLMRANGPVNANPVDGTSYSANTFFGTGSQVGSGNYVVFNGTGNSLTVTNLSLGNTYHIAVFEYNDFGSTNVLYYTVNPARAVATFTAPQVQATNAAATPVNTTSAAIHWVNGNGHKRIVLMKSGTMVNAVPTDNTGYTANTAFGLGDQIDTGNYVIYNGTGDSVTVTGLGVTSNYHVAVFEYNDFGSGVLMYQVVNPARALLSFGTLPVTFIDFTAQQVSKNVLLKWSTAQEFNSSRFEIERNTEGRNYFEKIGSINAAGNSSIRKDYSYTDAGIVSGRFTYRLKQIDIDERFVYSKAITIVAKGDKLFRLLGNPVQNQLQIDAANDIDAITISIFDNRGRRVFQETMKNQNRLSIDIHKLGAGVYIVELGSARGSERLQFVKMN